MQKFNDGTCSTAAGPAEKVSIPQYTLSGLTLGNTYSVKVIAIDKADNESVATCSSAISVSSGGGGGGGGRIKYTFTTDSYTGTLTSLTKTATGGTSTLGTAGAGGSVVVGP